MQNVLQTISRAPAALRNGSIALAAFSGAQMAHAAIDVTAVTDEIAQAKVAVMAIGSAVVLVFVGIALYKWIRRAF